MQERFHLVHCQTSVYATGLELSLKTETCFDCQAQCGYARDYHSRKNGNTRVSRREIVTGNRVHVVCMKEHERTNNWLIVGFCPREKTQKTCCCCKISLEKHDTELEIWEHKIHVNHGEEKELCSGVHHQSDIYSFSGESCWKLENLSNTRKTV